MEIRQHIKIIRDLSKEQFEALEVISKNLNSPIYQDSLVEGTLDMVIGILKAERGIFARYDKQNDAFSIISARNLNKESIKDLSEFSSGILKRVIEKKEPVVFHDVQADPGLSQFDSVLLRKIKSVIGVPILQEDEIWGVIVADSQTDRKEFSEANLGFLKYFSNLVSLTLDRIIRFEILQDENQRLKNKVETVEMIPDLIGASKPMQELARVLHRVANSDATVLIQGESGTGKDLAAQAIHKLSSRSNNPYIAQFCGSIPDALLESELFGYKKGAFTGANSDKKGLLEVADKGTFFLDEIADISIALQAKLLRVLENREIIRLGDTSTKKIDVRVISATNKDLRQLIKAGTFREDLFYRLNVFPVRIPALRERKEDIPLLVDHFIKKFSNRDIHPGKNALLKLEKFHWPGNVRQLLNVIQRAVILCDGNVLDEQHIILEEADKAINFDGTIEDFERRLLLERLDQLKGNRTQTAESLGVSVRWVQLKLKEMGI